MKVGIVGYGVEGKCAEAYWRAKGDDVVILTTDDDLSGYDLLVRSPGVHPSKLPEGAHVTSVTNEFLAQCSAPVIGVTGTKGKGTTSSLIAEMLKAAGKHVHLGGNIGTPALDLLPNIKPLDVVVLEMSSFQLMDAKKSPHIAVCLMIVAEHLDYHADEQEYWDAKGNIFAHQGPTDIAVYNQNSQPAMNVAYTSPGSRIPYDVTGVHQEGAYVSDGQIWYQETPICNVTDVALLGAHNLQNVCAAIGAAWQVTQDVAALKTAISTFRGLPYRLEEIAVKDGIRYVNDSISTTPESTMAAVQAFGGSKLLILGGSDKGVIFTDMAQELVKDNIKAVAVMGETGPEIIRELKMAGYPEEQIHLVTSVEQAVQELTEKAEAGDTIILSPACASFDMFMNYKDRGDQFNKAVMLK